MTISTSLRPSQPILCRFIIERGIGNAHDLGGMTDTPVVDGIVPKRILVDDLCVRMYDDALQYIHPVDFATLCFYWNIFPLLTIQAI